MTGYNALANAIIEQAAKDFKAAQRKLQKDPYNINARRTARETETFFCSDWFKVLTPVNGPAILKQLKEEFNV